jgi:hypothetical protein
VGAEARLRAIFEERAAIMRAFPDLGRASGPGSVSVDGAAPTGRKRRGMSPAQRKAVGKRMKAYWAKRRAERASETSQPRSRAGRKARKGMSAEARKRQGERMKAYWAAKRAQKADGAGAGTQSDTAGQNGAATSNRGGKAGRKRNK